MSCKIKNTRAWSTLTQANLYIEPGFFESKSFLENRFGDWTNNKVVDKDRTYSDGSPRIYFNKSKTQAFYLNKEGVKTPLFNVKFHTLPIESRDQISYAVTDVLLSEFKAEFESESSGNIDGILNSTTTLNDFYDSIVEELIEEAEPIVAESLRESKQDYIDAMIKRLRAIGINYTERIEDDNEEISSGAIKQIASYARRTKDKASLNIKLRLEFLPEFNSNNEMQRSSVFPSRVALMNPSKAWAILLPEFSNIPSKLKLNNPTEILNIEDYKAENMISVYMNKLGVLSKKHPWAQFLYTQMKGATLQEQIDFFISFNNVKNKIWTVEYIPGVGFTAKNTENSGSDKRYILSDWKIAANDVLFNVGNKPNKGKIRSFKALVKKNSKALNDISKRKISFEDLNEKLSEATAIFADTMSYLDIPITRELIQTTFIDKLEYANNKAVSDPMSETEYINTFINYLDNISTSLASKLGTTEDFNTNLTLNLSKLATIEATLAGNIAQHMATVGKNRVYTYSLPTVLQEQLNELKDNPELVKELLKHPKFRNSLAMKAWSNASVLSQVDIGLRGVLQKQGESRKAKDSKDIKEGDYLKVDMFNVLRLVNRNGLKHDPLYNTQVPADKTREYLISMKVFEETDNIEEAVEIFYNYVIDEYQEMILAKQEIIKAIKNIENIAKVNKTPFTQQEILDKAAQQLVLGYTLDGNGVLADIIDGKEVYQGGAFKFRLFSGMNSLDISLFNETGLPIADNMQEGDIILDDTTIKNNIKELIKDSLLERVQYTKDNFEEYGNSIFFGKDGRTLIPLNDSMDRGILNYYLKKYKDRKVNNIAQEAYNAIFRDYTINSMISKIEYAKIFTGNLQYYKSDSDYIKRVPSTYIDGLQPITGITEGDVHFRQMTFATEKLENSILLSTDLPDSVKKYYRSVDKTDAQGWITPERWKFIMERTGQLGTDQIAVYNKMKAQWEALEKGEEIIPLTNKEANTLSAQPLKGVYFKNDYKKGPLYLKYSQAVLLPQFVASFPKAKALLNYMRIHNIDEAVADSGVKVGALKPVALEYKVNPNNELILDIKGKHAIRTLDNRNWRLQQQLPTKGIHPNKIGTQIQKIIVDKLRFLGDKKVTDKMTGIQLADAIDNALATLSNVQIERFAKKFGIDGNYKIHNIEAFYKSIIEDMDKDGEGIQNYIDILQAEYPAAMLPTIDNKIISTFLASNKRAATNLLTPGGALIQISDHLLNVSESVPGGVTMLIPYSGLKPPTFIKGKKTVIPGQVFIPHAMIAKLIPDYDKLSMQELNDILPKEVKELIGYRIPTQKRSSTEILEVVGILPPSMGDSIITYSEITAKTGSDFDIDKLFFMLPELELLDNGKYRKVVLSTSGEKGLRNNVFKYMSQALHSPVLYEALMTSIDNDTTESAIKAFLPEEIPFNLRVFDPIVAIKTRFALKAGQAGIGETVNANNDHMRSQARGIKLDVGQGKWGNEYMDEELSKPLTKKELLGYTDPITKEKVSGLLWYINAWRKGDNRIPLTVDELIDRPIASIISELTNGFVDIANKDAFITKGNFGSLLNNYATMLIRTGVHPYKVTTMLLQPAVRELVKEISVKEGIINNTSSFTIRQNLLKKYQKLVNTKTDLTIDDLGGIDSMNFNSLLDTAFIGEAITDEEIGNQYIILKHITDTVDITRKYGNILTTSKLGESGVGKTISSLFTIQNKLSDSFDHEGEYGFSNLSNKFYDESGQPTLLMTFYLNTLDYVSNVIESNPMLFFGKNRQVMEHFNKMAVDNNRNKLISSEDIMHTLLENSKIYMLSSFDTLNKTYTEADRNSLLEKLWKLKGQGKFKILSVLHSQEINGRRELIMNQVSNFDSNVKNELINSWKNLLNSHPELGQFLVHEAYSKSGFKPGPRNFSELIPPLWLIEKGFDKFITNEYSTLDDSFSEQFLRNADGKEFFNNTINASPIDDAGRIYKTRNVNVNFITKTFNSNSLVGIPKLGYDQDTQVPLKLLGFRKFKVKMKDNSLQNRYDAIYLKLNKVKENTIYYNSDDRAFGAYVDPNFEEETAYNNWERVVKNYSGTTGVVSLNNMIEEKYRASDLIIKDLATEMAKTKEIYIQKMDTTYKVEDADTSNNEKCIS